MINKELLAKVRRIELKTSRLVTDVFSGQYHSVFQGQGIEFEEVREYQIGDDVRTIDWNVTARNGRPFVKKFVEERELTVMILVDASASMKFATSGQFKSQLAAEISALLSLAAIRNQDKVGLMMFTDRVETFIPAGKGSRHVLRIVREVLSHQPQGRGTNLAQALRDLNRVMTRRAIVFVISDFLGGNINDVSSTEFKLLRQQLAVTNKHHDVICVTLNDERERNIFQGSLMGLRDLETGRVMDIDASSENFRRNYRLENDRRLMERTRAFNAIGIDSIDAWTDQSFVEALVKLFRERKKR